MVLWEITLGTAYFLGLKRTYRLALKLQRRVVSPKHPKIRQFVHGRTRAVFDVALKVHRNIQESDIEVGRNVGNWILRWLDKIKPSAQIRGSNLSPGANASTSIKKQFTNHSSQQKLASGGVQKFSGKDGNQESGRHLFTSARNIWPNNNTLPTVAMMMRPSKPLGTNMQYRYMWNSGPEASVRYNNVVGVGLQGVFRKDIMQWMLQH